jgi:hypothetical protein
VVAVALHPCCRAVNVAASSSEILIVGSVVLAFWHNGPSRAYTNFWARVKRTSPERSLRDIEEGEEEDEEELMVLDFLQRPVVAIIVDPAHSDKQNWTVGQGHDDGEDDDFSYSMDCDDGPQMTPAIVFFKNECRCRR